jgi:hypothetical protein
MKKIKFIIKQRTCRKPIAKRFTCCEELRMIDYEKIRAFSNELLDISF